MKNKKKLIIKLLMIVFLIGIIVSGANIVLWYIENKNNREIKKELDESITIVETDEGEEVFQIDFESLKSKNPDTVGYIKVNNTNIDYVVVKTKDNSYYLKHNFNKENNRSGWIFMDYHNKLDGNDKNIVIYGHNTRDGSMFGTLRKVVKKEWYENKENHFVSLIINGEEKQYQVFSTYSIDVEDYYIKTEFTDKEFKSFIKTLLKRSVYNYQTDVNENDHILTLSTCTGNGTRRMVLHAKELV